VIATFGLLWWPFCAYASPGITCSESLLQGAHRGAQLFPRMRSHNFFWGGRCGLSSSAALSVRPRTL